MNYSSKKLNKLGSSISNFLGSSLTRGTASAPRASQPLAPTPMGARQAAQNKPAGTGGGRAGNMRSVSSSPARSGGASSVLNQSEFRGARGAAASSNKGSSVAKAMGATKAAPAKKAAPKTFATAKKAAAPKSLPMKGTKNKPATKSLAKSQGYNDRLDESLGARKGKKTQSMKARRDESKGASKAAGKGAYNKVSTMDSAAKTARKAGRAQVAAARTAAKKTKVDTKVGRIQSRTGRKIARINKRGAKR